MLPLIAAAAAFSIGTGCVLGAKHLLENSQISITNFLYDKYSDADRSLVAPKLDPAERKTSEVSQRTDFDPEGYYAITGESGTGWYLFFAINNKEWNLTKDRFTSTPLNGWVGSYEKTGEKRMRRDMTSLSIIDGKIFFETESVDGISYKFSGDFFVNGRFAGLEHRNEFDERKFPEGTLTTMEPNGVITTEKVKFHWFAGI
ncbi:MAG: hypothetical protein KIS76_05425 [Pyrinomonadaceae bacterium]|nr:hypothetical protein [Pyrinomonadaceae bacterium]